MSESLYKIIRQSFGNEQQYIIKELQKELNFQKHIGKGTLYLGFYHKIVSSVNKISLFIMNDTPYMWTVNNGKSNGVNATYQAIADWTHYKEVNGELRFSNAYERNNFINTVKKGLEDKYLTKGGDSVAPRRYFFIDFVRDKITTGSMPKRLKDSVFKEVDSMISKEMKKINFELKIS